jgi:hypothetical protein
MRLCARPGCSDTAAATLTYNYGDRTAWLDHPIAEPHPGAHDLCVDHADRLRVPMGWSLQDRRAALPLLQTVGPAVA